MDRRYKCKFNKKLTLLWLGRYLGHIGYFDQTASQDPPSILDPPPKKIGFLDVSDDFKQKLPFKKYLDLEKFSIFFMSGL